MASIIPGRADTLRINGWARLVSEANLEGTSRAVTVANFADLGGRLDAIDKMANKGVHAEVTARDAKRLLISLVTLSADALSLTEPPPTARMDPYAPAVHAFARQLVGGDDHAGSGVDAGDS